MTASPVTRRPGAQTPGLKNSQQPAKASTNFRQDTALVPAVQSHRLWHAFADHGGGRCSQYVGDFRTALFESLRYGRDYGGRLHIEAC